MYGPLGPVAGLWGRERAPLSVEPVERRLVDQVPGELVQDEHPARPQQLDDAVERVPEVTDRVQRPRRHDRVVRLLLVEILQPDPPEAIAERIEDPADRARDPRAPS